MLIHNYKAIVMNLNNSNISNNNNNNNDGNKKKCIRHRNQEIIH